MAAAVEQGLFPGPRLFVSGRPLSQTGGHGDFRRRTTANIDACACGSALGFVSHIADGVTEVRKAARDELRKGAAQIKVMVSGGVASPSDPIDNKQYSAEELRAIVEEAAGLEHLCRGALLHPARHRPRGGVRVCGPSSTAI